VRARTIHVAPPVGDERVVDVDADDVEGDPGRAEETVADRQAPRVLERQCERDGQVLPSPGLCLNFTPMPVPIDV